ncbi:amino acid adenylation domain-containing protein [Streptomyces sp. NBC_00237]|uniref:non-ribosomal peptide synthetase n=1 Tax=Streptomyces sp. NBC_00237 TaxID=2975687 RepID=UPI0022549BFF|nr:non-ribosomal peptide synthetase [Streptomyces sp. NBC_00237]MCX5206392.1 amino acid adenylation domain-containing protein [Streptomyces sp. NBC_00237]
MSANTHSTRSEMPANTHSTLPSLPTLFARQAALTPDALALIDGDSTLTYRQLLSLSEGLAVHLQKKGLRPGEPVALLTRRSARTVVAQLALWWAGAVCVPLDPAHPKARTEAVVADSGAVLTVGDGDLLAEAGLSGPRLVLDADLPSYDGVTPLPGPGQDAAAFIMFTSGSTGRPKGVAVRHRAVAALAADPSYVTVGPRDRVLLHSPATFDASTFEVWVALANGAAVVVCPADRPSFEDLVREVERHSVTVAFFTTALFHQLAARRSRVFALLRSVVVGGEALSVQHAEAVLRAYPWLELVNGYGPTETTTFATAHRVTEADLKGPMPVGRPIAGATAHVLDEDGRAVAVGEVGELWIGGSRLAEGYVGQPELTAERFVVRPGLGRLYRTGDLASVRADGVLDFHGRTDDQVKVRGHRIEPGEIEHALRERPEVEDAAVTVRRATPDDVRLAAFVVLGASHAADPGTLRASPAELRSWLGELMPPHLVPDELTVVERLPLTATGKVDRRALVERGSGAGNGSGPGAGPDAASGPGTAVDPGAGLGTVTASGTGSASVSGAGTDHGAVHPSGAQDGAAGTAGTGTPSLTPLQQAVAEVWARSLGCEVASPDDDFLALGGHSLLALVVTDDLREDLGVELSLADFFASPTVAGHAALVERALLAAHTDLHPLSQSLEPAPSPDTSLDTSLDAPEHTDVP